MYRRSLLVIRALSAASRGVHGPCNRPPARGTGRYPRGFVAAVALALLCRGVPASAQDLLRDALRDFRVADHWIYDDWAAARRRAAVEKKPIFAVFRCVP